MFDTKYRPTKERSDKLATRLKTYTLDEVKTAIRNLHSSPYHRGENDKGWKADPDFLLRNDSQIDKWLNYRPVEDKPKPKPKSPNDAFAELDRILEEATRL